MNGGDGLRERIALVIYRATPAAYEACLATAGAVLGVLPTTMLRPAVHCYQHTDGDVERACEVMHDAYEAAAAREGGETQERSRKPWADVPEANKATMRAAVRALLTHLAALDGEADSAPARDRRRRLRQPSDLEGDA